MTLYLCVVAAAFGLVIGSFLNVVVHRVPRGESVVKPRSRCPGCGSTLAARDNIPVVSWLLLRGRCRTCGTPISPRYPVVEAVTGALFVVAALRFGYAAELPAFAVFFAVLLALSAVDLERFLLPNKILYPGLFVTAALLVGAAAFDDRWGDLRSAVVGGLVGFGLLYLIHLVAPRGMGFGDVRLAGLIGFNVGWLSIGHVFVALFLGFLVASVVSVALIASKRRSRKDRIPFGPFLAAGAVLAVLVGQPLLNWYLR